MLAIKKKGNFFKKSSHNNSRTNNSRTNNSRTNNSRTNNSRTNNSRTNNSRTNNSRTNNSRTNNSRTNNSRTNNSRTNNSRIHNTSSKGFRRSKEFLSKKVDSVNFFRSLNNYYAKRRGTATFKYRAVKKIKTLPKFSRYFLLVANKVAKKKICSKANFKKSKHLLIEKELHTKFSGEGGFFTYKNFLKKVKKVNKKKMLRKQHAFFARVSYNLDGTHFFEQILQGSKARAKSLRGKSRFALYRKNTAFYKSLLRSKVSLKPYFLQIENYSGFEKKNAIAYKKQSRVVDNFKLFEGLLKKNYKKAMLLKEINSPAICMLSEKSHFSKFFNPTAINNNAAFFEQLVSCSNKKAFRKLFKLFICKNLREFLQKKLQKNTALNMKRFVLRYTNTPGFLYNPFTLLYMNLNSQAFDKLSTPFAVFMSGQPSKTASFFKKQNLLYSKSSHLTSFLTKLSLSYVTKPKQANLNFESFDFVEGASFGEKYTCDDLKFLKKKELKFFMKSFGGKKSFQKTSKTFYYQPTSLLYDSEFLLQVFIKIAACKLSNTPGVVASSRSISWLNLLLFFLGKRFFSSSLGVDAMYPPRHFSSNSATIVLKPHRLDFYTLSNRFRGLFTKFNNVFLRKLFFNFLKKKKGNLVYAFDPHRVKAQLFNKFSITVPSKPSVAKVPKSSNPTEFVDLQYYNNFVVTRLRAKAKVGTFVDKNYKLFLIDLFNDSHLLACALSPQFCEAKAWQVIPRSRLISNSAYFPVMTAPRHLRRLALCKKPIGALAMKEISLQYISHFNNYALAKTVGSLYAYRYQVLPDFLKAKSFRFKFFCKMARLFSEDVVAEKLLLKGLDQMLKFRIAFTLRSKSEQVFLLKKKQKYLLDWNLYLWQALLIFFVARSTDNNTIGHQFSSVASLFFEGDISSHTRKYFYMHNHYKKLFDAKRGVSFKISTAKNFSWNLLYSYYRAFFAYLTYTKSSNYVGFFGKQKSAIRNLWLRKAYVWGQYALQQHGFKQKQAVSHFSNMSKNAMISEAFYSYTAKYTQSRFREMSRLMLTFYAKNILSLSYTVVSSKFLVCKSLFLNKAGYSAAKARAVLTYSHEHLANNSTILHPTSFSAYDLLVKQSIFLSRNSKNKLKFFEFWSNKKMHVKLFERVWLTDVIFMLRGIHNSLHERQALSVGQEFGFMSQVWFTNK